MLYEPVRIGVIGCDGYPQELIKRLWTIPHDGVITAAMSPRLDSPGAEACRHRGIPVFDQLDTMLDAGGFDVVINATPIHLHARLCRQCMEAGYPVWMEKPPTATIQELDELIEVSESLGIRTAVCFNSLYSHRVQELKLELVTGRYGGVRRVRGLGAWVRNADYFARSDWSGKTRLGDAWVLDGSINNPFAHVVCNGLFFAGAGMHELAVPTRVEAELYHANDIESEDTSSLRILTREGVEAITHFTLAPEREIAPVTIIETDAAEIQLRDFETVRIQWRDGSMEERESYRENRIEMLQHLCRAFRLGNRYHCELPMCRPFTLAVNAAFDSSGRVHPIPASACERVDCDGISATAVRGINDALLLAHEKGALLSEIQVPWSRAGQKQSTDDYQAFPTRYPATEAVPTSSR